MCKRLLMFAWITAIIGCDGSDGLKEWQATRDIGPLVIAATTVVRQVFELDNPSANEHMTLRLTQRSCRCLDVTIEPKTVPPRGKGTLIVSANISPSPKETTLVLRFETGLKSKPNLTVLLHVKAFPPIAIEPPEFSELCVTAERHSFPFWVTLCQDENANTEWPGIVGTESVRVEVVERTMYEVGSVKCQKVACLLRAPRATEEGEARAAGQIHVHHGGEHVVRDVSFSRASPVTCQPKQILFYGASVNEVHVRLRAEREFMVTAINVDVRYLHADLRLMVNAKEHLLRFRCIASSLESMREAPATETAVLLNTDYPGQPSINIPVFLISRRASE
jgi:hypothetical protein